MAKDIRKGTELNNVNETWDANEKKRESENAPGWERATNSGTSDRNDLEQVIKEEATEYDNVNKEDRVLSGERASINDDSKNNASDE